MRKINHNIFKILTFSLLFCTACEKDDLILEEPSHRVIFTSEMDFENKINVGEEIALGDVSAGVVSRKWTFPAGVVDIIGSDDDVTSEEATVRAIFNQIGDHPVRLEQVFENPAYVGTTQTRTQLDTTIIIRVLDFVSISLEAFFLNNDGSLGEALDLSGADTNVVPASRTVRYIYTAIGEPENFLLEFAGGDPEVVEGPQEFIDVKYKRLGTYGVNFIASRDRPFGRDTVTLTDFVNVVPSTEPLTIDEVTEKEEKIALVFSREVDPNTVAPETFSVEIKNLWNTFTPAVTEASIDPEQGNVVLLTLDNESIYNDDEISVSYLPGDLTSADGIKADSFTNKLLVFRRVNVLKETSFDFSFENGTVDNWVDLEWGAPFDSYSFDFNSDIAYNGGKSLYLEFNPNGGMIIGNKDANGEDILIPVEQGQDYELGLWVYVEQIGSTPPQGLQPDIRIYWQPETDWGIGPNPEINTETPVGEWFYSSAFMKFNDVEANFMIRGFNGANPEAVKVYIDNITLAKVRLRP